VATWKREVMPEWQREGIANAKAAGKNKGRPVSIDAVHIKQLRASDEWCAIHARGSRHRQQKVHRRVRATQTPTSSG
jgi:DNA invertase Pin-like site-specific DNA recombinase